MNTGTILDAVAAADPARAALIIDGRSIDYGELAATVRQCAAGLSARGVVAGQRVAVVDSGSRLSIATMLGAARIGAAAALMNPALTPAELRGLLKQRRLCRSGGRGGGLCRPGPRRGRTGGVNGGRPRAAGLLGRRIPTPLTRPMTGTP